MSHAQQCVMMPLTFWENLGLTFNSTSPPPLGGLGWVCQPGCLNSRSVSFCISSGDGDSVWGWAPAWPQVYVLPVAGEAPLHISLLCLWIRLAWDRHNTHLDMGGSSMLHQYCFPLVHYIILPYFLFTCSYEYGWEGFGDMAHRSQSH